MKTFPVMLRAFTFTAAVLSAVLMGVVSTYAQTFSNINWVATSPADFSTAVDWDKGLVPGGSGFGATNTYAALLTNGVECDYASPDNYFVGQMSIAPWNSSSGTFVLNSGTLTLTTNNNNYALTIGGRSGANGSGGAGQGPTSGLGATGSFTVNGGTLNVIRYGNAHYHQDAVFLGLGTNSVGTFTMNLGNFNCYAGIEIGNYGAGIFNLNGGTIVDNGWFGVGRGNGVPYGSGTFNMTGGSLYIMENTSTAGSTAGISLDQGCTNATVNISSGSVYSGYISFNGSNITPRPLDYLNIVGGLLYIGYGGVQSSGTFTPFVNISGGTFHTVDMYPTGSGVLANSGSTTNVLSDGTNWTWVAAVPANLTNSSFQVNGVSGPGYVTFAPEVNRAITLANQWSGVGGMVMSGPGNLVLAGNNNFSGSLTLNGGNLAIAAPQTDTGGLSINAGNVVIQNNGSLLDPTLTFPSGSSLIFSNSTTMTLTNDVTGPINVQISGGGVVNLGSNLQNTGNVVQNNGILVLSGTVFDPNSITNSTPSSVGPLVAQGNIISPIGVGTNSSIDLGTTVVPGTLNAGNVTLNGTWIAKINTATTIGGGVNDLLVCTNLTLGGSSVLNIETITAPSVGTYVLAEYSGTLTGTFGLVTNATRDAMSISYTTPSGNTPGEILLTVGSSNPANLTWSAPIGAANINWDVNTSTNWTNSATLAPDVFYQQDAVTFTGTPGATPVTNRVSVATQVLPSSITINGGLGYIFSGTGHISGGTGINYNDTNTSGIYTAGNNYTGPVNINNGVLQLGSGGSSWLGVSNTTTVNGGTLDLNAQGVGAEPLVVQGAGSAFAGTNGGAINNSASTSPGQSAGPLNITLSGDTTLNASGNRWDIGLNTLGAGGGSFKGNGYNLTKIGNQQLWLHELGDIGVGNIDIQRGLLGFQYTIGMGIPSDTITVESGATLGFYQLSSNSVLNKQMVLNGNATLSTGGGAGSSNNFAGPITLNGTNSIQTSIYPLNLTGNITGTGGFTLSGTGPLYLGGDDTYSGPTLMAGNSVLALESGGSIPNTPLIYLTPAASTTINASGAGSMTLNSGQTLEGSGLIVGNFTANSGSTIFPGTNATKYGTMIFTNNLTLNGDTNDMKISDNNNVGIDNDIILVNGTLTLSGISTFIVTPIAALNSSSPYALIEAPSGITGTAQNVQIISASPRYTMSPVIGTDNNSKSALMVNIMGNAAPLEWEGYLTPNWDLVTSNWYNMGTATHDHFYTGDNPTFDDSASVTAVVVTNNVIVSGMTMSNVVKTYTFSGGGVITGPLNMEGNGSAGGMTVLAMSNAPAFTTIDSSAGTLVYNLPGLTNYVVGASITDSNGNQAGTIIFGGTNTATLAGDNNAAPNILGSYNPDFDGTIWVTNGILQYTNVDALGVDASVNGSPGFSPLIVTNNGSLNFNGVAAGPALSAPLGGEKWIHISGNGFNGQGALMDSGNNQEPNGAFCYLYFDTNATIGIAATRCDEHVLSGNAQQIEGNGYNLTFIGGGAFFIYPQSDGDTHLGNIDVASTNGGRLAFQGGPDALGNPTNYLTVEPNGEVTFYNFSNNLDNVHLGIQKNVWLKGGNAAIDSAGNAGSESNNFDGPLFLTGTNLIGVRYDMHVWNSIMDSNSPGGFILGNDSIGASSATAALWLDGANSYTGPTIVSNATLRVGASSSLGSSAYVQVNTNATLDLSATPSYSFGTGQTMAGNGTVIGPAAGNLNFNSGSMLAIGLPTTNGMPNTNTFTLSISNSVVLNAGSTDNVVANKRSPVAGAVPVDELAGPASLTLGGTVVISSDGTNFVGGDSLVLFSATTITTNSGFNIVPATPGANLAWDIRSIPVNGTLGVVSTVTGPSFTNPPPISVSAANNQLMLTWPANYVGYYYLQVQTNPLSIGLSNNWVPYGGSISATLTSSGITNGINLGNGTVFYRLMTNAP
ncbi:MAG TPA: autotransporter-associated beta strand repeat-containing protein [Verrucomicrobiae bacterium]|nr:autotransporter-associated beta strand repeat-containing protein [Verrucomicrobiae bacterium]